MGKDDAGLLLSAAVSEQFRRDYSDEELVAAVQLFRAVRFLAQRMNEAQTAELDRFGVSATQFNYLAVLYVNRHRGLTAGELGTSVRTTSGTVTTMLKSLERNGLVARHAHPTDGRISVLKPTPKGARLYVQSAKVHHEFISAVYEQLGPVRSQQCLNSLIATGNALHHVVEERKER